MAIEAADNWLIIARNWHYANQMFKCATIHNSEFVHFQSSF